MKLNNVLFFLALFFANLLLIECNRKAPLEAVSGKGNTESSHNYYPEGEFADSTYYAVNDSVISQPAETEIYATPDHVIDGKKNLVYGIAFHLAWDQVKKKYGDQVNEGLKERGLDYLGTVKLADQLEPESYVAKAGQTKIVLAEADKEMKEKFNKSVYELNLPIQDENLILGYLGKFLKFKEPFEPGQLRFKETDVHSISTSHYKNLGAVEISHYQFKKNEEFAEGDFIFRLTPEDSLHELIIAKVNPGKTMQETYRKVKEKFKPHSYLFYAIEGKKMKATFPKPGNETTLIEMPKLNFEIYDEIQNLKGMSIIGFGNVKGSINYVRLRLDEKGVWVVNYAAAAVDSVAAVPQEVVRIPPLIADRSFLLVMKKKNQSNPYLMVWIENDKILLKK